MKKDKTASNLGKKLKQYSALAISAVAADASAQVVYTDIRDTALVNDGDFFDIDLNNDGITEINLNYVNTTGTYYAGYISYDVNAVYGNPLNGANINVVTSSVTTSSGSTYTSTYVAALNLNESIGANLNSWDGDTVIAGGYGDITFGTSSITITAGELPGAGDKFIGVRFQIGGNTHYGWIRIDMNSTADSTVIKDFAYEATANTPILAGDKGTPVGLGENFTKKFDFYSSVGKINFKKPIESGTELTVYDLSGRVLMQERIAAGNRSVSLKDNFEGVYIVELRSGNSIERKRLWLESE